MAICNDQELFHVFGKFIGFVLFFALGISLGHYVVCKYTFCQNSWSVFELYKYAKFFPYNFQVRPYHILTWNKIVCGFMNHNKNIPTKYSPCFYWVKWHNKHKMSQLFSNESLSSNTGPSKYADDRAIDMNIFCWFWLFDMIKSILWLIVWT